MTIVKLVKVRTSKSLENRSTAEFMKKQLRLLTFGALCGGSLLAAAVNAQTEIEGFEYASDDELLAMWLPSGNAMISVSDAVSPQSSGMTCMKVEFNFPSIQWATETVRGSDLGAVLSIASEQYLTFRLKGDPAFAAADFRNLYLYAYDEDGNFGRWGKAAPTTDDWQIVNFKASGIEKPWDSTALPDLSRIIRFAFFQYGSEAAIEPYTATIYVDDLMVRDTPLIDVIPPAPPRELIDDFEGYADTTALQAFYAYQTSPAATVATASLETPAPQGSKALKLAIDFAPGQYPWGSVRSPVVAPFSFPTNAVVSVRFKGDPALAGVADNDTTFWLSFYDKTGAGINFITGGAPVVTGEWTTLQARLEDFGDTSTVDVGNLVQWRILVQGWMGIPEQAGTSAAFYIDDIRIAVPTAEPPILSMNREAAGLKLIMDRLVSGKAYELRSSADLAQWGAVTVIHATSASATWDVPAGQNQAFYLLVEKAP